MYTIRVQRLFALTVALVDETVGLLGNIFFEEMSIVTNDSFQRIIEHNRSGIEVTVSLSDPFSSPDRSNDMGMPELAGIPVDDMFCYTSQTALEIVMSKA